MNDRSPQIAVVFIPLDAFKRVIWWFHLKMSICIIHQDSSSQSVVPEPAALGSPGELYRDASSQALPRPHWIRNSESGRSNLGLNLPSRWFWCMLRFENHCIRNYCLNLTTKTFYAHFKCVRGQAVLQKGIHGMHEQKCLKTTAPDPAPLCSFKQKRVFSWGGGSGPGQARRVVSQRHWRGFGHTREGRARLAERTEWAGLRGGRAQVGVRGELG